MTDKQLKEAILRAAIDCGLADRIENLHLDLHAQRLTNTKSGKVFVAKGTSHDTANLQLLGEAEGLRKIHTASPDMCPKLHHAKKLKENSCAIFLSDFIHLGRSTPQSLMVLAEKMAGELHNPDSHQGITQFGFAVPTHCGVTQQDNTWDDNWMIFYRDHRIGDLLSQIERKRGESAAEIIALGKRIQTEIIPTLLTNFEPAARPVLLHGDLWSGNIATVNSDAKKPVVYDCSSYYGHNEADFGISRMFGPFDQAFYDTYHALRPKSSPHWEERQELYELYHHLNHYLMFGAGYASGATSLMQRLLAWGDRQSQIWENSTVL